MSETQNLSIAIGIKLFHTVLIPQLYYNCETWSNLPAKLFKSFDDVCLKFLKRILKLPKTTPAIGLLAETGIYKAYDKINAARAIYYKRVLNTNNKALAKVLQYQQESGLPCYWIHQVHAYLQESDLEKENAQTMDIKSWKRAVHSAIQIKYTRELSKNTATKTKHLTTWKQQPYITKLQPRQARNAVKYRLKMIDTGKYYKAKYANELCQLCREKSEDLLHVLTCKYNACNHSISIAHSIIDNVHSNNPDLVLSAVDNIEKTLKQRQLNIDDESVIASGSSYTSAR